MTRHPLFTVTAAVALSHVLNSYHGVRDVQQTMLLETLLESLKAQKRILKDQGEMLQEVLELVNTNGRILKAQGETLQKKGNDISRMKDSLFTEESSIDVRVAKLEKQKCAPCTLWHAVAPYAIQDSPFTCFRPMRDSEWTRNNR